MATIGPTGFLPIRYGCEGKGLQTHFTNLSRHVILKGFNIFPCWVHTGNPQKLDFFFFFFQNSSGQMFCHYVVMEMVIELYFSPLHISKVLCKHWRAFSSAERAVRNVQFDFSPKGV